MATRADFTDDEWKAMQEGITGAGMFVAIVDQGFFDSFKEANALAHHLREAHDHNDSMLVRALATGHERPFGMTAFGTPLTIPRRGAKGPTSNVPDASDSQLSR